MIKTVKWLEATQWLNYNYHGIRTVFGSIKRISFLIDNNYVHESWMY